MLYFAKMDEKNKEIIIKVIIDSVVLFGLIIALSRNVSEEISSFEIGEKAMDYINNQILPMEGIEGNAEIAEVRSIDVHPYTHEILAIHEKEGHTEGGMRR